MDKELRQIELDKALEEFKEGMGNAFEIQRLSAKMLWNYFNELMKNGFTEAQSLDIIKAHGCFPPSNNDTEGK